MPVDAASNPASGCDMNWCLTSVAQSTIEPPQFVSASPSLPHNLGTLPSPCRPANKKAGLAANNKLDRPVHVPRPPNPFIVYRMEFVNKEENRKKFNYSQPALSRACGEAWRKLTLEERKPYQELSVNEGIKHAIENPGYRYSPGCFSHSPRTSKSRGCLRRRTAMLSNTKYNSDITDCSPRALTARRRRRYSSATSQSTISTRRIEAEPTHVPDQVSSLRLIFAMHNLTSINPRPNESYGILIFDHRPMIALTQYLDSKHSPVLRYSTPFSRPYRHILARRPLQRRICIRIGIFFRYPESLRTHSSSTSITLRIHHSFMIRSLGRSLLRPGQSGPRHSSSCNSKSFFAAFPPYTF